jgi:hypothetical protein
MFHDELFIDYSDFNSNRLLLDEPVKYLSVINDEYSKMGIKYNYGKNTNDDLYFQFPPCKSNGIIKKYYNDGKEYHSMQISFDSSSESKKFIDILNSLSNKCVNLLSDRNVFVNHCPKFNVSSRLSVKINLFRKETKFLYPNIDNRDPISGCPLLDVFKSDFLMQPCTIMFIPIIKLECNYSNRVSPHINFILDSAIVLDYSKNYYRQQKTLDKLYKHDRNLGKQICKQLYIMDDIQPEIFIKDKETDLYRLDDMQLGISMPPKTSINNNNEIFI